MTKPLARSAKILVQVGTIYQPTGWEEIPTTFRPNGEGDPVEGFRIEKSGADALEGCKYQGYP